MGQGKYGEGNVQAILDQLNDLKSQVQSGKMSLTEFTAKQQPLINTAIQNVQTIAGQGSKQASAVNPIWGQMQQLGYVTSRAGKWTPTLPFSQSEYAQLPSNVLPTQGDVQKGLFDPTSAPMARYQNGTGGVTNNPVTGTQPQQNPGPDGQPLPQITPTVPGGVDTRTDQGQIDLQGANNASALQDALNKQYQVNQQAVGQLGDSLNKIPGIYNAEGQKQQDQLNALASQQQSSRAQSLSDLGGVLAKNQMNLFNQAIPDLAEQANTAGMFRSTGFGDSLARQYTNLTANTQSQLAQQGITDREAYLGAQQNALNTGLGYSGQAAQAGASGAQTIGSANAGATQAYGAGLGDVANAQIGMQNAGLQRQFSLSDYTTQYQNALNLANSAKTQGPTGKASPGTQAWTQGSLAAVNAGVGAYKASQTGGASSAGSGKGA